jgi:hypothetical protein
MSEIHRGAVVLPGRLIALFIGVTIEPDRARCIPLMMTQSSGFNPERTTRRPSINFPSVTVRRHIIWNNQQLDLKEDLAHLV